VPKYFRTRLPDAILAVTGEKFAKKFSSHDLRRTVATRLAESLGDAGDKLVRRVLGHSDMIVLMTLFNALSHGSQDLYMPFLLVQRGFSAERADDMLMLMNVGALFGGLVFGPLSERLGRRRAIVCATLLCLPVIPLWTYAPSVPLLALGAFLMQFMVQGAWGIVPVHLNELSPPGVRAVLPAFAYQLGNFAMAFLAPLQSSLAGTHERDLGAVLVWTLAIVATVLAVVTLVGTEAKSVALTDNPVGDTVSATREAAHDVRTDH
jgi:SHS family lactate transporter-like MFS transporter